MPIDMEDRGQALENEYFRRKEQEVIAKMKAKLESEDAKNLEIKCPKCDGTLVEADFESIKIDVCNNSDMINNEIRRNFLRIHSCFSTLQ